jgi:hypothetical protein
VSRDRFAIMMNFAQFNSKHINLQSAFTDKRVKDEMRGIPHNMQLLKSQVLTLWNDINRHAAGLESFVVYWTMAKSNILIFHRERQNRGHAEMKIRHSLSLSLFPNKSGAHSAHTHVYIPISVAMWEGNKEKNAYFQFIIRAERNANRRPSGKSISCAFHFFLQWAEQPRWF